MLNVFKAFGYSKAVFGGLFFLAMLFWVGMDSVSKFGFTGVILAFISIVVIPLSMSIFIFIKTISKNNSSNHKSSSFVPKPDNIEKVNSKENFWKVLLISSVKNVLLFFQSHLFILI